MKQAPGPSHSPLLQTLQYLARPEAFLRGCHRRHGDVFAMHTVLFGPEVCVVRPEAIKKILTADIDELRAGEANVALEPLVGPKSVALLDGVEHLRQRRLVLQAFHGDRMRTHGAAVRESTVRIVDRLPDRGVFALYPWMQRLTLDVILRSIFGVDGSRSGHALGDALITLVNRVSSPWFSLGTVPPLRHDLGGWSPWAVFKRLRDRVDALTFAEIAMRRARPTGGDDVLSTLLGATDDSGQPLTDAELRDQLITLLAGGYDTIATSLCWAFELLLRHPHVLDRLRAELAANDGDVERLPYLDATVKEVLRLRPVIPAVGRRVQRAMRFEGFDVSAGTLLVPRLWLTHRLPDIYPDPEAFQPERFLDKKPDPYAWLPFGGGSRRCIGMAFALYEMKIVLATLLQCVDLRLERQEPVRAVMRLFMYAPAGGLRVTLRSRTIGP